MCLVHVFTAAIFCAVQQKHKDEGDKFNLDKVKGPVKLRKEVEIGRMEQIEVWGYTQVRGHSKRVVVCTESQELLMKGQVMSVNTKSDLLPHKTSQSPSEEPYCPSSESTC